MYYNKCSNFLLMCACLLIGTLPQCHDINDTYQLLKDKLANYDKTVRPTRNQSESTVVSFSFYLTFLQELDEVNQKLSVIGTLGLNWTDDMMNWDPARYGSMTSFLTESERFWTPNLVLTNNAEKIDKIGDEWQSIRYTADGGAYYHPTEMFSTPCKVDVTYYPWDRHFCILTFTPQGYFPAEVQIKELTSKVDMSYFTPNGAWKYVDSSIQRDISQYYSNINVFLIFERNPRFAVVNVILPIVFMAFLSVVVFLIPPDSGERISYTITMLLAMAVFLTFVGDNLPKNSNPMPIFCNYLITMLATNVCISMLTIFNLRLFHTDDKVPVSGCWARLAECCKAKKKQTTLNAFSDSSETLPAAVDQQYDRRGDEASIWVIKRAKVSNQVSEMHQKPELSDSQSQEHADDITWKDISAVLDKISFFLFCIITIVATVVYLVTVLDSDRATIHDGS